MHKMILGAVAEATEMDCNIYHSHLTLNFDGKLMLFFRIYCFVKTVCFGKTRTTCWL